MKTTKRILGLIIAFTMIIPLISMQTIFALSWYHMESLRFDQIYADVVNISIDVKKNENLCYMFTLSAPSEPTDPYSTVTWINLAGFTLTPTGEIRANIDGQWLNTETEGQEIGKLAADKQWHNITIKYRNTNKTAAIYLDGVKLTTCDYMQRVNTLGAAAPQCNMVTVSGDSKDKGINGLEYKLKSVTGSNEGEMTAVLSELNEENCELTVDFSERPKGSIRGAYLQNVNIEAEESPVALTQKSVTGTSVTFGYSGSLSKFQKYALVLPDDINGSDNGILSNRYIYFTSCGGIEEDVRKFSDYTNYVNTVDVTFQQARIVDDATYGKSLEMVKVNDGQASYDTWNWNGQGATSAPTGDGKSSVSFDAKALRSDLHMAYELAMPGDSLTNEDFNIIWDTNGNLLANVGFPSDGWTTNHGDEFGFKGTIVGTYKADEWINFRMDIDKTVSPYKVSLYINNKFINTYTNANWTNKGTETFSRFRELKYWVNSANTDPMHNTTIGSQGDALMRFDNFTAGAADDKLVSVGFTNMVYENSSNRVWELQKANGGLAVYDVAWGNSDNAPTGEGKSVISFDAKAMRGDLHMVYELAMPGDSLTNEDFNIIWDTNGNLLANVGFPSDGWTTNHGDEFGFKGTIVGTYKADEWINFRMDIDKTVSPYKVSLYINNKFINTYTNANWTNKGTETFSRFRELKYWVNSANTDPMHNTTIGSQGDALMQFDNFICIAEGEKTLNVSDVKVKMKDNSVVGPYDMVDGEVEYIEVYYNGTIAENALKNVVLKHNNTRLVPCTVTPITDKNGFKLTPVNILKAVRPITLSADATEAGAYTCNFAGGNAYVLNANIKLVDGSGNKAEQFSANTPYHVAAEIDNWTDEAKTVALYAARYEGNLLTEIVPLAPPAIAKDASFDINNATDSKLTVTPSKNDTQIKVFAFSGDNKFMPLCGAYSAFKAQ